jgi:transcriptional regulator with XRE-family HTH domain
MSWEQLGVAVRARRKELGLTQAAVATAAAVSVERLRDIERSRRPGKPWPRVKAGLEAALQWESGSVEAVLAGGVAIPTQHKPETDVIAEPTNEAAHTSDMPPAGGDRYALARQVLSLRATLSAHQGAITAEARQALLTELHRSAREAEEAIVRMLPWLDESDRGEAIDLLVQLRKPWDAEL